MSDIVEKLRTMSAPPYDSAVFGGPMLEAADEIERLRILYDSERRKVLGFCETLKGVDAGTHAIVPKAPTHDMIRAGNRAAFNAFNPQANSYRAMVKAASDSRGESE